MGFQFRDRGSEVREMTYFGHLSITNNYYTASLTSILFEAFISKLELLTNYTKIMEAKPAKKSAN